MNYATHPIFTFHPAPLNEVHQFTYLGSILTSDCDMDNKVQQRVKLASAAFGRLSHRVFLNHKLTTTTKVAVYKAVCISILLCGCETWTPYRRHIKALEAFHCSTCAVSKASLASGGGIRSFMSKSVIELLTLTRPNTCYCRGNSAGLGM